uniref:Putative secreted protein n=1 Tax=Anopheles darlingi TaxID=43151 RepID=A0A2M4D8M4_ANODA
MFAWLEVRLRFFLFISFSMLLPTIPSFYLSLAESLTPIKSPIHVQEQTCFSFFHNATFFNYLECFVGSKMNKKNEYKHADTIEKEREK